MNLKKRTFTGIVLAVLLLGVVGGFFAPTDDFFALRKNFQIFSAVYEELVGSYVDPVDPEQLMRSGIDAMLEDLDPYTSFIDESDNADIDIITRGRYGGVGLNIGFRAGKVTVVSPIEGASGYKQGVRAGDVITEIAGQPTEGMTVLEVRSLLRGDPGTAVEIKVEREGTPDPIDFLLTREEVTLKNVTYSGFANDDTSSGIAYVKLERFARDADAEVRLALQSLKETAPVHGVIIDLRDNPGGLLESAVRIVELFVQPSSVIVSTRAREAESERIYRSQASPLLPDVPLVVLTNGFSASASEIVAGAVQDLDRGAIVGGATFGKGLVQIIKPLPFHTSLKITTARYYTPSGRSIQAIDYGKHDGTFSEIPDSVRRSFETRAGRTVMDGRGIEPDVAVSPGDVSELEEALDRRAAFFFYANHFAATHESIARDFEVTDAVLDDFEQWLHDENFQYRITAERSLDDLASGLAAIEYDGVKDELEQLRLAVVAEKEADFERHQDRIAERLRAEILARFYGDTAQIRASLAHDRQFKVAVELLNDSGAYNQLLAVHAGDAE